MTHHFSEALPRGRPRGQSRNNLLHHEVLLWNMMLTKKIIVSCTCNVDEDAHEDLNNEISENDDDEAEYDGGVVQGKLS